MNFVTTVFVVSAIVSAIAARAFSYWGLAAAFAVEMVILYAVMVYQLLKSRTGLEALIGIFGTPAIVVANILVLLALMYGRRIV
jgi:hypothetical protein